MVDVFLTSWEWSCCGEPFRVGDRVEFTLGPAGAWLDELLAGTGRTGVLREMHHEDPPTDTIQGSIAGVVSRIDLVRQQHVVRGKRNLGRGEDPLPRRGGDDVWIGAARHEFVRTYTPLPEVILTPTDRVPHEPAGSRRGEPTDGDLVRLVEGYLVALDVEDDRPVRA